MASTSPITKCWGLFITADWPASSQKRAPIAKNLCVTLHLLSISKKYTILLHQEKEKVSDPQNMFPVEIHQNHPKSHAFSLFANLGSSNVSWIYN